MMDRADVDFKRLHVPLGASAFLVQSLLRYLSGRMPLQQAFGHADNASDRTDNGNQLN